MSTNMTRRVVAVAVNLDQLEELFGWFYQLQASGSTG